MLLTIDCDAKTTLGRQIETQLREAIRLGRLAAGERLPSTRMLAQDLCVSRGVVARAYGQLAAEGYLAVSQGSNPHVAQLSTHSAQTYARPPENGRRWRFDLRSERPDLSRFPRQEWLRSLGRALHTASDHELRHVDQRGLPLLREEISAYLGRVRGADVDPEHVVITACSTHAMTVIARALLRQGHESLAFENPGRLYQQNLVRRTGLEPVACPVDDDGLAVGNLEVSDVRCVVVSPAYQFPLGVPLADERRAQLLEWAERCDCIVVEDDNEAEFWYDRPPSGCLQALAPERVVYVGSASKTLAPGLRLGWAVIPSWLMEPVRDELWASTLHQPTLDHLAFADFIARGEYDRHIRRMRASYRRRRDLTIDVLRDELPELPLRGTAAGLQLAALTPPDEERNAQTSALAAGIAIETLTQHALPGYNGPRGLLIGFGATPEPSIIPAIRSLAHALHAE